MSVVRKGPIHEQRHTFIPNALVVAEINSLQLTICLECFREGHDTGITDTVGHERQTYQHSSRSTALCKHGCTVISDVILSEQQ